MIKKIAMQIQFLTRIPVPFFTGYDEKKFVQGIIYTPVVGLIVGVVLAALFYVLNTVWGRPYLAAVMVIVAEIVITGGLHLDGLADSADGFFSYRSKEETVRIMKDPRTGTNGVLAIISVLFLKTALILSLNGDNTVYYLAVMPVLSRMNIVWAAGLSRYAGREKGVAAGLVTGTGASRVAIASILSFIICTSLFVPLKKYVLLFLLPLSVLYTRLFCIYSKKKIGGITGDVIGAIVETSEIVILMACLCFESLVTMKGIIL